MKQHETAPDIGQRRGVERSTRHAAHSSTTEESTCSTMRDALQEQEAHQKTVNKNLDVLTSEILLFVAEAEYPCFKPGGGCSHTDCLCDRRLSHGHRIHKYRTLVQELWRDFYAHVVQLHPHCTIVHSAPHSVSRTRHDSMKRLKKDCSHTVKTAVETSKAFWRAKRGALASVHGS
jgi:hypothetical protein